MKRLSLHLALFCVALACHVHSAAAPPAAAPAALTADGGRYYGALVDGRLHGRGRIEWKNGSWYEGGFEKGLYSGRGILTLGDGHDYRGAFRNGMMSGRGRMRQPDGAVYVGEFRNGFYEGRGRYRNASGEVFEGLFRKGNLEGPGRLSGPDGVYEGDFRHWQFWGSGAMTYADGRKYRGEFVRGRYHGKGRFETPEGEVYEGDFTDGDFSGTGSRSSKDGARHEGRFAKWRPNGPGRYVDRHGNVYEGSYAEGELNGPGRVTGKRGGRYEGELKEDRFHGQGTLELPNGDVFKGGFANGVYEGEGTLTYAKPSTDGRTHESGVWRYGQLRDEAAERLALENVEVALYKQRALLDNALASLSPRDPSKINMYVLAVAGDGSQEVFRREVQFVRDQFDAAFGTKGRSVALINSRSTVASAPMATISSIRESLQAIAQRMDTAQDVLFLFLASHGSQQHEFTLNQNSMALRGLGARELAELLAETRIRWKVVVVSACYSGGFIEPLRNAETVIITAARHDRRSFGCSDDNDFTYFGRAFFKEALPRSVSFQDAFEKASALVSEWETADAKAGDTPSANRLSLPQISAPAPAMEHLQRWWAQSAPASTRSYEAATRTH